MLTASLISTVIGMQLPGPGAIYLGQQLKFLKPVFPGDTITARAIVLSYDAEKKLLTLKTDCLNQHDEIVLSGEAKVRYEPI
jgi:acyl dehydratase